MDQRIARTVAEATGQHITLPSFERWREFAGQLDGYQIAQELGLELGDWAAEQVAFYEQHGRWNLDVLGLRLMLFFTFRADRWTGWTYTEHDDQADSLLCALSEQLNLPYESRKNDAQK